MNSVITCSNACFFDLFWQFKCVEVSPSRLIHISFLNQCKSLTSKCLVGSNGGHFRRSWCGAAGILIIFRLMFPASYSILQRVGADGVTSRTFHSEGLFQLPWQSAAIRLPQGKLSLTSNLYSAVFLALNLACFAFISVQSMKGEQSIKISSQLCGKSSLSTLQYTWQTRLNSS